MNRLKVDEVDLNKERSKSLGNGNNDKTIKIGSILYGTRKKLKRLKEFETNNDRLPLIGKRCIS